MQKGKVVVWGGLTNSWEKKISKRQRRKGKIHPSECRVPKNSTHTSKAMLKIIQARIQQYVNCELSDVQTGFRKGRGTTDQIANIKSKRIPEKHLFLLYLLCQRLWLCGSQQTVENSERDVNTRPSDLPLEKPVCPTWVPQGAHVISPGGARDFPWGPTWFPLGAHVIAPGGPRDFP